ncbi:MAG: nucleotidyl transferase AbiEii/AbiGii toxin family protein [Candidatus Brocadiia bacterium]
MQDLIKQERFEMEVLDKLNSARLLGNLTFGGGTMLRLCFGLNRFSVDLDFWITNDLDRAGLYKNLKECLSGAYTLKDSRNKFYTILLELKSKDFPRSLKIEVRKEKKDIKTESAIAYSRYADIQVPVRAVSLDDMMQAKIEAFLDRKEIRDAFDIEFLLKKGVKPQTSRETAGQILEVISALKPNDYAVKLGSLLESDQRRYYKTANFKVLTRIIYEFSVNNFR